MITKLAVIAICFCYFTLCFEPVVSFKDLMSNENADFPLFDVVTYGGPEDDMGSCVQETSDGGFIIVGTSYSYGHGGGDIWLIKTNSAGIEEWNRTFGGDALDYGVSVKETIDGGFSILGVSNSSGLSFDTWLIKTSFDGTMEWDIWYGNHSCDDHAIALEQTSDGGYVITGYVWDKRGWASMWLLKIDNLGTIQWQRLFGGEELYTRDIGSSVQQTADRGYIIAGYTETYSVGGEYDAWWVKTDEMGNLEWQLAAGFSNDDYAMDIRQTSDNSYITTGWYFDPYTDRHNELFLIKLKENGTVLWEKNYGYDRAGDEGYCVKQTFDSGYIIVGSTNGAGAGSSDVWLIKTDSNGDMIWNKTFGGEETEQGYWVEETTDYGYVITGETKSYGNPNYEPNFDVLMILQEHDIYPPIIHFTHPLNGIYIADKNILEFPDFVPISLILGKITVTADAYDKETGIDKVGFYLDDKLQHTSYQAPYNWLCDVPLTGKHTLKAVAFDYQNNVQFVERDIYTYNPG